MAWTLAAAMVACEPEPPPPGPAVPEPTEALRPADRRGVVRADAHVVDTEIEARYDEEQHRIDGRARFSWRNRGPRPVESMPLHLYMNAFRAEDTAWMEQARGSHRGQVRDADDPWGYVDVSAVERLGGQGADGEPARTGLRYAEHDEPSLMTVWLDEPVPPGATVELEVRFSTQLPKVFARTGYHERFVLAGQWYPKPGVLEPDGSWRAHPFTLYSEFYADFGDYDVYLDLPADLVVGATGIRVSARTDDDRQTLHYRAEMVHDFAWTAGPDLVEAFDEYEGIRIRALLPAERSEQAHAHLAAQRAALESMEARFGPYPWSTITLVDPPAGAGGAGGMEYPTFFTTSPVRSVPAPLRALGFDHRLSGQFTTIHEFGHQYFQGLLASNEFEQPWLDEGLNTFSNMLVFVDWYGPDDRDGPWLARLAGHELGMYDGLRLEQGESSALEPVDQPASHFTPLVEVYGSVTYRKTAATMLTLRRLVGAQAFDAAMRVYAERFRFRHPTGADLEATLGEVLGERVAVGRDEHGRAIELSLRDYFDQALRSTAELDFGVYDVDERPRLGRAGWRRDETGVLVGGEPPELPEGPRPDEQLEGVVVVQRRGAFVIPVEIEVELSDGSRERVVWDGTGRYRVLTWPGKRVRSVSIDPDGRLVLESRRWNNTRYARGQVRPASRTEALGALAEASTLAIVGGLGP